MQRGKRFELQVADADGYNAQTVLASDEPIISPSWSRDGLQLAYVSFEGGRSSVFVQEIATATRTKVSDQPGVNGAPS